jgi:hypothetical protein
MIGVMQATAPVVARRLIANPRHRVKPVGNWASHPGERLLGRRSVGAQTTPYVGVGSGPETPGIGLFLTFWTLWASDRNGCARVWVSGRGCESGEQVTNSVDL